MSFTDTPEQAAVINAPADSDVLVVAGAGSGKTYTMTRRIIALIESGVAPERILGLTFTRKAAGELLDRVSAAVAGGGETGKPDHDRMFLKPAVFTYDAFFQSIVRQYGLLVGFDQNTQPLSVAGALQLATNVIDGHMELVTNRDMGSFDTLAGNVLALSNALGSAMIGGECDTMAKAVERCRIWDGAFVRRLQAILEGETVPEEPVSIGKPPKRTKKDTEESWRIKQDDYHAKLHAGCVFNVARLTDSAQCRDALLNLVEAYAAEKRRLNMAEFSDFTIASYQLVKRFPSIGQRYRKRFGYVLLDEYQDTSTTQAALLAALFHGDADAGRSSVNAVGDPFQSIYAWRGASPGAFRMFQKDFGLGDASRPFALSVTRRNSRVVLEAANNLTLSLRGTPRRQSSSSMREVAVPALGNLPDAAEGTLGVLGYDTLGQEIDGVTRFCKLAVERHAADGRPGKAAVLFRRKKQMPLYQEALERAGLRVFVVGYSALLERPEVRDLLALLRVAADQTDSASLMRLLATPRFGMGASDLAALAHAADQANCEARFRALVEAGLADGEAPRDQWADIVREHRDKVPNIVFLPTLLMRDDYAMTALSPEGVAAVSRAGEMLREIGSAIGRPLADVVRVAVEALDLDVDTVLAQALRSDGKVNPAVAHMPMDAIGDLVDTYASEIAVDRTPTLAGFVSWVSALDSVEDEAAAMHDERADVELMTVHQAKGLEWDAVAIVDMADGHFPSSQGDRLKLVLDERRPGGVEGGAWQAPEYQATARTWLTDPTAVPVPVRADADILPRFPHDAPVGGDPLSALEALEDVESVDDEVFGSMRQVGDGVEDVDTDGWYLTQEEEYGRRLHADERRLAYVALTRARHDMLLTFSRRSETGRDPSRAQAKGREHAASPFWQEVHDSMLPRPDVVDRPSNVKSDGRCVEGMPQLPEGFFAGEAAAFYEDGVVGEAWLTPLEEQAGTESMVWPAGVSDTVRERLDAGARAVREAIRARNSATWNEPAALPGSGAGADGTDASGAAGSTKTGEMAVGAMDSTSVDSPLLERAMMLTSDDDLMAGQLSGVALDKAVERKAKRIIASGRQNVTGLQALTSPMSEREARAHWRSIVRPVPSVSSPAAAIGTRMHEWAERFVDAAIAGYGASDSRQGADNGFTRHDMLEDLERRERDIARGRVTDDECKLAVWQRRLVESPWAERTAAWAERQIVVSMPELGGMIVNGKLDAVFHGGLDPDDSSKRFVVVDWKTGRRPTKPEDIREKLVQLDLYRLLLSAVEGIPLEAIDATLYYLSEPNEALRGLAAEPKSESQILAQLASGVPMRDDDEDEAEP